MELSMDAGVHHKQKGSGSMTTSGQDARPLATTGSPLGECRLLIGTRVCPVWKLLCPHGSQEVQRRLGDLEPARWLTRKHRSRDKHSWPLRNEREMLHDGHKCEDSPFVGSQ